MTNPVLLFLSPSSQLDSELEQVGLPFLTGLCLRDVTVKKAASSFIRAAFLVSWGLKESPFQYPFECTRARIGQ